MKKCAREVINKFFYNIISHISENMGFRDAVTSVFGVIPFI